jgi:hypothetical protein
MNSHDPKLHLCVQDFHLHQLQFLVSHYTDTVTPLFISIYISGIPHGTACVLHVRLCSEFTTHCTVWY